jgi:hypothetical protein
MQISLRFSTTRRQKGSGLCVGFLTIAGATLVVVAPCLCSAKAELDSPAIARSSNSVTTPTNTKAEPNPKNASVSRRTAVATIFVPVPAFFDGQEVSKSDFGLPAYFYLGQLAQDLGLCADQRQGLRDVREWHDADIAKSAGVLQLEGLSPAEQRAKLAEISRKFREDEVVRMKEVRRKVEQILTVRQLEEYKQRVFPLLAWGRLNEPAALKMIGANEEQERCLRQLLVIQEQQRSDEERLCVEQSIAILDSRQCVSLHKAIPRQGPDLLPPILNQATEIHAVESDQGRLFFQACDEVRVGTFALVLPVPYRDLRYDWVRKELHLSAPAESNLCNAAAGYVKELATLTDEELKLAPDRRGYSRFAEKLAVTDDRFRTRIETIIDAQQRADLSVIVYRMALGKALFNSDVRKTIGMTEQQEKQLARLRKESSGRARSAFREALAKADSCLTAGQRKKLWGDIDHRGGW